MYVGHLMKPCPFLAISFSFAEIKEETWHHSNSPVPFSLGMVKRAWDRCHNFRVLAFSKELMAYQQWQAFL